MPSLIDELERDALDPKVSVTALLQKCLVVGAKLKIEPLVAWARLELDGYKDAAIPEYRNVLGSPQVRHPWRGHEPLQFASAEHLRLFSTLPFNQPIAELEHSLRRAEQDGCDGFQVSYSAEVEVMLRAAVRPRIGAQPFLFVNLSQFHRIVEAVRKAILEWALQLDSAGVKGDGMSFSREETEKAHSIVYSTVNYIYGNADHSQIGTVNSTQGISLDRLKEIIGAFTPRAIDELQLAGDSKRELEANVQTLAAQASSPKPNVSVIKETLASIRNMLEGVAGNMIAAAILHQLKWFG